MKPTTLSWSEILTSPEDKIEFLLEPYIPRESIVLLHGRASLGKSPLTWAIGLSVASGLDLWGMKATKAPVLYIEVDSPPPIVKPRMKLLGPDFPPGVPFQVAFFNGGFDILKPPARLSEELHSLAEGKPALVIVNTLRKVFASSANDSETPSAVYRQFRSIFHDASFLFVHHDRKLQKERDADMESEDLSGSLAWLNDAQVALHLVKSGKEPGILRLDHTKSQATERTAPLVLQLAEDGTHLTLLKERTLKEVEALMKALGPRQPAELDKEIAAVLRCSIRSARRYRAQVQHLLNPSPPSP